MELSELKKLKNLETDHNRLQQLYAELSLENAALKDLLEKNSCAWREEKVSKISFR